MLKQFGLILALITSLLLYSTLSYAGPKQQHFIKKIQPAIKKANQQIMQKRQRLKKLYRQHKDNKTLKKSDKHWLNQLASRYNVKIPDWSKDTTWKKLNKRVDIVPLSLATAQAAIESAWGQSRFAKQANNFFGQHCYKKGCGLVPHRRAKHRSFEVRKFASPLGSVKSYIHNLNTGNTYKHLRNIRYQLRQQNKPLSGSAMAAGLDDYSQSPTYIKNLRSIIKQYKLQN